MSKNLDKMPPKHALFQSPAGSIKSLRDSFRGRGVPDLQKLVDETAGESDRATVIIMASLLEDSLRTALLKSFKVTPVTKTDINKLFRQEGPLGSFSTKMEIAVLFGVIEEKTYEQLNIIREMRNACAHSLHPMKFDDATLHNVLMRLFSPLGFVTPEIETDLKTCFVFECTFLNLALHFGSRDAGSEEFVRLIREHAEPTSSLDR